MRGRSSLGLWKSVTDLNARYDDAVRLLGALSGPAGIHASAVDTANYRAVFTRDAVMAGLAGLLVGDGAVVRSLVRTLESLRDLQGPEGQIASNYELRDDGPRVSFGTLAPRLDGATWYLVGLALAARAGAIDLAAFRDSAAGVVSVLNALEYNGRDLVYVPTGGNWADEYVYEGYVLYDQVLRAWALRLLGPALGEPGWSEKAARIGRTIDARYWPTDDGAREFANARFPIAAFTPTRTFDVFDLAACALLGVADLLPRRAETVLAWIDDRFLSRGALPPAFHPVIEEDDPDWPALARYHLHGFRNRPHEYHNGGVWPIWLGWLALALARHGRADALDRLRALVRGALDAAPDFAFEEYLHGVTGDPGGTRHMAYTATGLVFLHHAGTDAHRSLLPP
jgi:GH15 family glucan-1,4-alpha-glucosidase